MKRRILSLVASFFLTLSVILGGVVSETSANAPKGIYNNGYNGITININAAPYTTLATVPTWGQYAYTNEGCAWFASSRVRELTGKNCTIYSGRSWYNIQYANYGFTRGSVIRAKALACYQNHVAVIECFNADGTVTVSEGGYSGVGAANGYTIIHKVSVADIQSNRYGGFLGYVYLPGSTIAPAFSFTASTTKSVYDVTQKPVISWSKSVNAVKYKVTVKRTSDSKVFYSSFVKGNKVSFSLPEGTYKYTIVAYNSANTAGASVTQKFAVRKK